MKQYADLNGLMAKALKEYKQDVQNRGYPEAAHCYGVNPEVLSEIKAKLT